MCQHSARSSPTLACRCQQVLLKACQHIRPPACQFHECLRSLVTPNRARMHCRLPADMLRGKLSQLEHNVLAAAAASTTGGINGTAAGPAAAAATPGGSTPKLGATGGGALDLRSLLQSLGLGEEVVRGLAEVGVGPLGPAGAGQESEAEHQQQQGQGWQQAAGGSFRYASWSCAGFVCTTRQASCMQHMSPPPDKPDSMAYSCGHRAELAVVA